jgi:hypothetical protein
MSKILSSRPQRFDNIERAVTEMAYDNGVIHRSNTEESVKTRVMQYIQGQFSSTDLATAEAELAALTQDEFETLTCGEEGVVKVSDTTNRILNEIFDAL